MIKLFLVVVMLLPVFVFGQQPKYSPLLQENQLEINNFSDYVNWLYIFAIGIAALLAVVKIIIAGFKYMLTDIVSVKGSAKEDIKSALFGLLLIIGAVVIFETINPRIMESDIAVVNVRTLLDNRAKQIEASRPQQPSGAGGENPNGEPSGGNTSGGGTSTGGGSSATSSPSGPSTSGTSPVSASAAQQQAKEAALKAVNGEVVTDSLLKINTLNRSDFSRDDVFGAQVRKHIDDCEKQYGLSAKADLGQKTVVACRLPSKVIPRVGWGDPCSGMRKSGNCIIY